MERKGLKALIKNGGRRTRIPLEKQAVRSDL